MPRLRPPAPLRLLFADTPSLFIKTRGPAAFRDGADGVSSVADGGAALGLHVVTCAVGSSYYLRFALTLAMPFVAIASYGVALAAAVVVGGGRPGRLTASAAAQRWKRTGEPTEAALRVAVEQAQEETGEF